MTTDYLPFLSAIIVAALSGGFVSEFVRAFRNRKKDNLDLFYPTWKEEMLRMQEEVRLLRFAVVALSTELAKLGGDPLAVRQAAEAAAALERQQNQTE